jgi:hypothetical protein
MEIKGSLWAAAMPVWEKIAPIRIGFAAKRGDVERNRRNNSAIPDGNKCRRKQITDEAADGGLVLSSRPWSDPAVSGRVVIRKQEYPIISPEIDIDSSKFTINFSLLSNDYVDCQVPGREANP